MKRKFSVQISLRLFLLCCTFAAVTLAWQLALREYANAEREMQLIEALQRTVWTQISDATGIYGSVASDGIGEVQFAYLNHERAFDVLRKEPGVLNELESVEVSGQSAFERLQFCDLPSLKHLRVSNFEPSNELVAMLGRFNGIQRLSICWDLDNRLNGLEGLEAFTRLENLTLHTKGVARLEGFPTLTGVKSLTIYCTECSSAELASLRARMPDCHVSVNAGNAWLD